MVINMANKGILSKNYYIVPGAVADLGAEVYKMMAEADQAMGEASEIIAEIASLTERVPSQIRSNTLLEACASAQAEIKSVDFLSYGQKVEQGLQNLLDHNQYITEHFIKNMGTHTEKMRGLGEEFKRLTDSITYSGENVRLKNITFSAVSNVEDENLSNQGKEEDIGEPTAERDMVTSGLEILSRRLEGEKGMDSDEKEWICTYIRLCQPSMLINLYITDCYSGMDANKVYDIIMEFYRNHTSGKYFYPAEYIEGIIMDYEEGGLVNGRFELYNKGKTIAYGHDVRNGEDFTNGLSMGEGIELAINDLDEKYDTILRYINVLNTSYGKNIHIEDFTENEIVFLLDFAYNRGAGLVERDQNSGEPFSSLAILIVAVSENDQKTIIDTLKEEVYNTDGVYETGLERRRMDEYEILTMGDYVRNYDLERGVW